MQTTSLGTLGSSAQVVIATVVAAKVLVVFLVSFKGLGAEQRIGFPRNDTQG